VSNPTRAQDKEDAEYVTKIMEECQRWGLNVDVLKTEYLNIGNDIQNMKLEDNIEIKGSLSVCMFKINSLTP
jgi:hypothetical protein